MGLETRFESDFMGDCSKIGLQLEEAAAATAAPAVAVVDVNVAVDA